MIEHSNMEFDPKGLEMVIASPYAEKRLKNRTGRLECDSCNFSLDGKILEVVKEAKEHEEETEHVVIVYEDSCRLGLIQQ